MASDLDPEGDGPADGLPDLDELKRLRFENEELRSELEEQERTRSTRVRTTVMAVFVVLFALSLPATAIIGWLATTVFDEDTFVATLGPLPSDPAVARALGEGIAATLVEPESTTAAIANALPESLRFLAPAIAQGTRDLAADLSAEAVASDAVASTWQAALRLSHAALMTLVQGGDGGLVAAEGGGLVLDLSDLARNISVQLADLGIDFLSVELNEGAGKIRLYESDSLAFLQSAAELLHTLRWVLPLLAVVFIVAALWVSADRRRATLWLGAAAAVSMLLLLISVRMTHQATVGSIEDEVMRAGAESAWSIVLGRLVAGVWSILVLGLIVALVAWAFGPSERAVRLRRSIGEWQAARRAGVPAPEGLLGVASQYRSALQWGAVAVGSFVLLIVPTVRVWIVIVVAVLVVGFVLLVQTLASDPAPATSFEPDAGA